MSKYSISLAIKTVEELLNLINEFLAVLNKGTKAVEAIIDDIFKAIKEWLEESFGIGKKTTSQIEDFKNGKLKENEKIEEDGTISKRKDGDITRSSNFAEMVAHQKWESITTWSNGVPVKFKALHTPVQDIDQPIKKGIDAIYENELFTGKIPPPKYIINEVKYNTTNTTRTGNIWRSKLSKTKHGVQMSDEWIEWNLKEMFDDLKVLDIKRSSYKYLTGVSQNAKELEIFELTNSAKNIKSTKL